MLAGKVPDDVLPVLYGANLIAPSKPGEGIRPIAVDNILRRYVCNGRSAQKESGAALSKNSMFTAGAYISY